MRIVCIGGGPAGLYFSLLMKKADPSHDITVLERNPRDVTFGWGVVFSDETLGNLFGSDPETAKEITDTFAHWKDIDTWIKGRWIRSSGHGFSGIARKHLLSILQRRCEALGVNIEYGVEVTDLEPYRDADLIVACDGVRSFVRTRLEQHFRPQIELNPCRYIWLGTHKVFDAFTFLFEENEHGIFQVHAYRFDAETSTFIVECDEETWRRAGLDTASEEASVAYLERLFARHLDGKPLLVNKSQWIQFVTLKNESWFHENVVLMGDAVHTAHFSIGSGTKLAVEDAIALADAMQQHPSVPDALAAYQAARKSDTERLQKAAQDSRTFFETVKRHWHLDPETFVFAMLTRSKRIGYQNLKVRDPAYVKQVTESFAREHSALPPGTPAPPPMFTPYRLREVELANRVVVSPMCMYSAREGLIDDFHLVHYGELAMGGAGLVFTEMTDVSPEGRITPGCAGMYAPEHVLAWKRVVDFVHGRTGAKIGMQLAHAGRKASTTVPWAGGGAPLTEGAWETIAPSAIPYAKDWHVPREMSRVDMDRVKSDFVRAAGWAAGIGFDVIELHFAHGYLLHQFLSPLSNRRTDGYGGSPESRMRYPLEVFDAVRAAWPASRPISVRISATDWVPGGFTPDDAVILARALKEHGADVIDVSSGGNSPDQQAVYGRMFNAPFSDLVRAEARVPTMTVGNVTSADQVNTLLAAGRADLVVLAREHLRDPHFTLNAALAQGYEPQRWPPQYQRGKLLPRR